MVLAVTEAGGRVYLGGEFTRMVSPSGTSATRNRLAALDVTTKNLLPWNPDANGTVRALQPSADGRKLYVGGDFSAIGGSKQASKVALIDLATGTVDRTFRPGVKGRVRGLALAGDRLFVVGDFTSVTGPGGSPVARPKVAALDAVTGALLPWTPPALNMGRYTGQTGTPTPEAASGNVYSVAVPADGSRVYVAGNFLNFAGQGGLLALDGTTGQALPEQWQVGRPVFDLATWPADGKTFFAAAGGPGGRIYAFRPDEPSKPLWHVGVDGDAMGVAASKQTVFLMGHYDFIIPKSSTCFQSCPNGTERRHLAAFDAATGMLDPWNPKANTSTGPFTAAVGGGRLFIGGEFTTINRKSYPGFAQFALPPDTTPSTTSSTSSSSTSTTTSSTSTSTTSSTTTSTTSSTTTSTTSSTTTSTTTSTVPSAVESDPGQPTDPGTGGGGT